MISNPKPPTGVKPDVGREMNEYFNPELPVLCASFYHKGLERMAEAGKTMLDMAAQQNAMGLDIVEKALRIAPNAPEMHMLNAARVGYERAVDAQKKMLDLAVEQSAAFTGLITEKDTESPKIASRMADVLQQSFDRAMTAQRITLDVAAQQSRTVTDAVKKQAGVAGTPVEAATESIQKGVDAFVSGQKDVLDAASKSVEKTASAMA
jgi:hypothetical protein